MLDLRLFSDGMEQLLKSGDVDAALTSHAEDVLARAEATAPQATGAYRGSLQLRHDVTDRAVVRVVAAVPHAVAVEARHGTLNGALGG